MPILRGGSLEDLTLLVYLLSNVKKYSGATDISYVSMDTGDLITTLGSLDKNTIKKLKKQLQILGINSAILREKSSDQSNVMNDNLIPPIDKIVVDGSNVARYHLNDKKASAKQLYQAYDDLLNLGFKQVFIIIGAGLRHSMGRDEFLGMEQYFSDLSIEKGFAILNQAPAGMDDDEFIYQFCNR